MIALHEPTFDSTDEAAVLEALRSTWVSTGGPFIDRFERGIADFVGAKHAVATSNGTLGLMLALEVTKRNLGITSGFEVIVPTLSFAATANAVLTAGGVPVLADSAIDSMNIDVQDVERLVRESYSYSVTKKLWESRISKLPLVAIMPAHLMGYGCDIVKLRELCEELQVELIEDAAEALGVRENSGKHLGTYGKAGVFSFNGNKILTTGGGGMIVTNDDNFAKRAKHLSTTAKVDGLRFAHDELGYNFRLVNLLAALGCSQLAKLGERLVAKRKVFEKYRQMLTGYQHASVYSEPGFESNHWIVNLLFHSNDLREAVLAALIKENIQARPLWTPGHRLPYLQNEGHRKFPNAELMWERVLSVPSSANLTPEVVELICMKIRSATEGRLN